MEDVCFWGQEWVTVEAQWGDALKGKAGDQKIVRRRKGWGGKRGQEY